MKAQVVDESTKNLLLDEVRMAMEYISQSSKSQSLDLAQESLNFMKSILEKL